MKSTFRLYSFIFACLTFLLAQSFAYAGNYVKSPHKVFLFAYATEKNDGHNGLHFAWSQDKVNWHAIGPEHSFLKCDYGTWGGEKRMLTPTVILGADGLYHCLWSVNEEDNILAHAASKDLVHWKRQTYIPVMPNGGRVYNPEVKLVNGEYIVTWFNGDKLYTSKTTDFKKFSAAQTGNNPKSDAVQQFRINGNMEQGTVWEAEWELVDGLIRAMEVAKYRKANNSATAKSDSALFVGLKPVVAEIKINTANKKKISNLLTGVFFEDINYAADGGLYAELVQNRGFEYTTADKRGKDKNWNERTAWSGDFRIDSLKGIHANNPHFAVINNGSITNSGFDGIPVKANEKYNFSIFAKGAKCSVKLIDASGAVLAQADIKPGTSWKKYTAVLKPVKTVADARLEITTQGETAVDMVSLFPEKTFKNRKNGLRADLAQTVADIHPKFVRFPGGCVAHGNGLDNIYRWKNTVGPLEARKPMRNIWNYHQSMGLGYFEYFQFCEDIGAQPVPVLAAGVPCQNSSVGGAGQQFGIPIEHMDEYVQDVLDLIEYANGSANTPWGKVRAEAGHPKPFNLKYIGIGNEDLITDVFEERYTMIVNAVRKKYPDVTIIGTVGPFFEGADYDEGWAIADKLQLPMVDEHYYESPGWFINNQSFYDAYDRSKSKVYLGEYASWGNSLYNALAEALYLTAIERNGDVVSMASYAPMLAREGHTQWNPDLIYFNGTEVKPTVNYFVQKLYGENPGDSYVNSTAIIRETNTEAVKRIGVSTTVDAATGDVIIKLVNLLPVAVKPAISTEGITATGTATYTVLTEKPESKSGKPVTTQLAVQDAFKKELPPYSFTVIRLKTK
ncbi:alpha-L-arabinofuranosidase C-terminal domain-containing protein [Flavobacterium sp. RHBU_3]|uniref:alpha-L-arabinofuranosidase C-terminal domain-containing protein n=1 Tax=Flavobacterium sp. RHBU_3 TaxID=3391184 RepID=UPI003984878D